MKIENDEGLIEKKCYQKAFVTVMSFLTLLFLLFLLFGSGNQIHLFFADGADFFSDFVYGWTKTKDPYNWLSGSMDLAANRCYPPLAFILLYPFSQIKSANAALLLGILFYSLFWMSGFLLLFDHLVAKKAIKYLIIVLLFISSIFLFTFERGNIIIISAVLAMVFLFEYNNENRIVREISYIALAISAGIKLYPALLGLLIIKKRRYREAIHAIIYGLIFFFVPFLFFEGGLKNLSLFLRNLSLFNKEFRYLTHPAFNFKYFAAQILDANIRDSIYNVFLIGDKLLVIAAVFAAWFSNCKWKETMILSLSFLYCSIHSGIYVGFYSFPAIIMFLNSTEKSRINTLCLLCIVLFLNPVQIVIFGVNMTTALTNLSATVMELLLVGESIVSHFSSSQRYRKGYAL